MYNLRSMCELYAYEHHSDDIFLIFDDYVLDDRLDKDALNEKIMLEHGERKCYWRHTALLKSAIDNWFFTHNRNIRKLVDTTEYEYNPLFTRDYYEDFVSNKKEDRSQEEDTTTASSNTSQSNSTNTNEISAYDTTGYQPQDKNTGSESDTSTNSSSQDRDISETKTEGLGSKLHHYGKENDDAYADIIEKERKLALFNIYDWIIRQLDDELFIGIY